MKSVCIIPARGGSKRIPRKNIRSFLGKPIMAYSIEAAQQSGLFDEVMVSTDDPEVAEVSMSYGASVPFFRSAETASDHATTAEVLTEVLLQYEQRGQLLEMACCLYSTAPFITPGRLQEAAAKLETGKFDVVYPVSRFRHSVQQAVKLTDSRISWFEPEYRLTNPNELPPVFHDAGQFYVFAVPHFLQTGKLLTTNTSTIEIPEFETQDIDDFNDWQLAELKYTLLKK
jgi:N-acylneuraminate cytidylyltransferase